ncbi:MAG: beta galactosidase jelly roll domain-containing protein [Gemmataceae bacterium]|nr:beta galactosidase jelly roll domain-containing protein [Gemmataceae bacterium]
MLDPTVSVKGMRMTRRFQAKWWAALAALVLAAPLPAADRDVDRAIAALKGVGREGTNNETAGPAWRALVGAGGEALMPALAAIDDADPRAGNWLRAAVVAIAEAEGKAGRPLPAGKLEAFTKDTKNAPSARRVAFDLLGKQDPAAKGRLLPGFLNDKSPDLRREAIAAELAKLEKADPAAAKAGLLKLFAASRDEDQVDAIAKKLEDDHKSPVSVTEHYAFINRWQLVGPFPSEQGKALTVSHPPETLTEPKGTFKGKADAEVTWKPHTTTDKIGAVDLTKAIGVHKDAAAYALAVVTVEKETPAEIRVTTQNAVQIFLNGKKLFEREEYHHGEQLDYNVGAGVLKAGPNVIVVKVCQNDQKQPWAQKWQFAARVCDPTGGRLPGLAQLDADGKPVPLGFNPNPTVRKEDN